MRNVWWRNGGRERSFWKVLLLNHSQNPAASIASSSTHPLCWLRDSGSHNRGILPASWREKEKETTYKAAGKWVDCDIEWQYSKQRNVHVSIHRYWPSPRLLAAHKLGLQLILRVTLGWVICSPPIMVGLPLPYGWWRLESSSMWRSTCCQPLLLQAVKMAEMGHGGSVD